MKFKENILNSNLSVRLHHIVKNTFVKLENNSALEVEYGESKYGDFISINLNYEDSILIDLCVTQNCVDLLIGKSKTPYYEMTEVHKEKDLEKFENVLLKLIKANINELWYASGNILFKDLDENEIFVKNTPIFSFFWPKRITNSIVYKPWIKMKEISRSGD